jgi:hypothetical protein
MSCRATKQCNDGAFFTALQFKEVKSNSYIMHQLNSLNLESKSIEDFLSHILLLSKHHQAVLTENSRVH